MKYLWSSVSFIDVTGNSFFLRHKVLFKLLQWPCHPIPFWNIVRLSYSKWNIWFVQHMSSCFEQGGVWSTCKCFLLLSEELFLSMSQGTLFLIFYICNSFLLSLLSCNLSTPVLPYNNSWLVLILASLITLVLPCTFSSPLSWAVQLSHMLHLYSRQCIMKLRYTFSSDLLFSLYIKYVIYLLSSFP